MLGKRNKPDSAPKLDAAESGKLERSAPQSGWLAEQQLCQTCMLLSLARLHGLSVGAERTAAGNTHGQHAHLGVHVGDDAERVVPAAQLEEHLQDGLEDGALQREALLAQLPVHVRRQLRLAALHRAVQQRRVRLQRVRVRVRVMLRVGLALIYLKVEQIDAARLCPVDTSTAHRRFRRPTKSAGPATQLP